MLSKLLGWLKKRLLGITSDFYELDNGKYLKVKQGKAKIVNESRVPSRKQNNTPNNVAMGKDMGEVAKVNQLSQLESYQVAKRAARNSHTRTTVVQNPELVDADSQFEAETKIDIADGKDVQGKIESNPKISESDVESMLETDFMAKWGYNCRGSQIASDINSAEADGESGESGEGESGDAPGEGDGIMGTGEGADVGGAEAVHTDGPTADPGAYGDAADGGESGEAAASSGEGGEGGDGGDAGGNIGNGGMGDGGMGGGEI